VRNLPDGRVEAHLEGEAESVDRVEAAVRRGPGGARVDEVFVDQESPLGAYRGFSIK
jgi:acylphosphatase